MNANKSGIHAMSEFFANFIHFLSPVDAESSLIIRIAISIAVPSGAADGSGVRWSGNVDIT